MDALTAKLGKLSKPQIILTAAGAGIAMAIAYRLADRTLDSIIPKKKSRRGGTRRRTEGPPRTARRRSQGPVRVLRR